MRRRQENEVGSKLPPRTLASRNRATQTRHETPKRLSFSLNQTELDSHFELSPQNPNQNRIRKKINLNQSQNQKMEKRKPTLVANRDRKQSGRAFGATGIVCLKRQTMRTTLVQVFRSALLALKARLTTCLSKCSALHLSSAAPFGNLTAFYFLHPN